jgi:hypothetical protein
MNKIFDSVSIKSLKHFKTILLNKQLENYLINFTPFIIKHFYNSTCVYFLWDDNNKTHDLVYIGKTGTLANRIMQHVNGTGGTPAKVFTSFSYILVSDEIVNDAETILIGLFKPKYNTYKGCSDLSKYFTWGDLVGDDFLNETQTIINETEK